MKKLCIFLLLAFVACAGFAQTVVYDNSAFLAWDPVTVQADGSPRLAGDVVTYDVYFYDYNSPPVDVQNIAALQFAGSTLAATYEILFPDRRAWVVGVRATIADGGGTSGDPSPVAWSIILEDVDVAAMGGPFYYIPRSLTAPADKPTDLRDTRY